MYLHVLKTHFRMKGRAPRLKTQQWQASNFSLRYYYLIKQTGHKNKGNDHQFLIKFSQLVT